jgi:hypothetical protein
MVFKRGSVPPRCTLGSTIFREFFEERLELKSLKRQTKAEELGQLLLDLLILRLYIMDLYFEPFLRKNSRKTCC